jgi:hypothetical protein
LEEFRTRFVRVEEDGGELFVPLYELGVVGGCLGGG